MEKTFVVTGASRGIGYDLVQHVASQGHTVYALSRSIKTIKKTINSFPNSIPILKPNNGITISSGEIINALK